MGRKYKPRMIPEQDRRICGCICLCQLTVVTSCVALVYLTVVIYVPSHRTFTSGYDPVPVMCETFNTTIAKTCDVSACGEWCLTKSSGCPLIDAIVRQNGTDIQLENCSRIQTVSCPMVDSAALKRYNCNNGSECGSLTGFFNCSLGHCANMSDMYQCSYKVEGPALDSEKDNMKMTGFFECNRSRCTKLKGDFYCERYCPKINTYTMNVYLLYEDSVYTADCSRAVAYNSANGTSPGYHINATEFWHENGVDAMFASCLSVTRTDSELRGRDCLNGTLLREDDIPQTFMNFTTMWKLYYNKSRVVDPEQRFLPMQSELTIYNKSSLRINLDGCVNTLRGECRDFVSKYGRDGRNQTARSRYLCYHHKEDGSVVVARFDLQKTWRELVIAVTIPTVLFVLSSATLCFITRSVSVGDDAKMRCKYCASSTADDEYEEGSPARGATRTNTNECLLPSGEDGAATTRSRGEVNTLQL